MTDDSWRGLNELTIDWKLTNGTLRSLGGARRRWPVLLAAVALTLLAGAGASRLGFVDEYRIFFGPDNPQLLAFDAVEATYTKNDNITFVLEPPDGDAFSSQTLAVVEELTHEAWKIPFAIRVESLSNFQHTWAKDRKIHVLSVPVALAI